MRRGAQGCAIVVALGLAVSGCSSDRMYTVAHQAQYNGTGSVDLILPDATRDEARSAIRDYARGIDGPGLYYLKVLRAESDQRYVCRARWYRDAAAFAAHTVDQAAPSQWPHITIVCP